MPALYSAGVVDVERARAVTFIGLPSKYEVASSLIAEVLVPSITPLIKYLQSTKGLERITAIACRANEFTKSYRLSPLLSATSRVVIVPTLDPE